MADVQYTTLYLPDGTGVSVIVGSQLYLTYMASGATTSPPVFGTTTSTNPAAPDVRTPVATVWFHTPFGPQPITAPDIIDEYRRRDYAELTAAQAAAFYASGAEIPDVSYVTGVELPAAIAAEVAKTTGPTATALRAASVAAGLDVFTTGHPSQFVATMKRDDRDLVMTLLGDSTGNETTEWFYLLLQWLGQQFPAYTIDYRLWNDTNQSYDAPTTVQTGTGAHVLHVYNGSVPGAPYTYPIATQAKLALMVPAAPSLLITSYGYNDPGASYRRQALELGRWINGMFPGVEYVVVTQPPKSSTSPDHTTSLTRSTDLRRVAARQGWGLIDATQPFLDYGNYDALINADTIHPNAQGMGMWAEAAKSYFSPSAPRQRPPGSRPDVDRIFVDPTRFIVYSGTPALTFPGGVITPKWDFDPAAEERLICSVDIPPAWEKVDVQLIWSNPAGTVGNVVWQVDNYALFDTFIPQSGKIGGAATSGVPITVTTQGTGNVQRITTPVYQDERFPDGRPTCFRVRRLAADAGDTFTLDAYFYGLLITRVA